MSFGIAAGTVLRIRDADIHVLHAEVAKYYGFVLRIEGKVRKSKAIARVEFLFIKQWFRLYQNILFNTKIILFAPCNNLFFNRYIEEKYKNLRYHFLFTQFMPFSTKSLTH